ncbi:hypothetical protein Trydic_g20780 [Trypoxylus dichotomus]
MESTVSPIITHIFMEDFGIRPLNIAKYKPKLWLRYVDNTFIVWIHSKDELQNFLSHLHSIHPKIRFTMKTKYRSQLPFLDVLVITKQDGILLYRKATRTNRCPNAQSYHHPPQIQGVVKALVSRSQRLADTDYIRIEDNEIKHKPRTNRFTNKNKQSFQHEKDANGHYH